MKPKASSNILGKRYRRSDGRAQMVLGGRIISWITGIYLVAVSWIIASAPARLGTWIDVFFLTAFFIMALWFAFGWHQGHVKKYGEEEQPDHEFRPTNIKEYNKGYENP